METIGSNEAKTQLPRLLDRVAKGETITITRHGISVARLVPVEAKAVPEDRRTIEGLPEFHKGRPLTAELFSPPADLLAGYHRLVDKRFSEGLTPGEERRLSEVSHQLDRAELLTPIERAIDAKSTHEHQIRLEVLNDVIARLKSLQR
jgi:prevent-host-death family protein